MEKFKSLLGYIWAAAALLIVLATFYGNDYFSQLLARATGITVSPWYSGGEIMQTVDHGNYKTFIHRPVFDSLIGQKKEGFIQINWSPAAELPPVMKESVDCDGDGREDFIVTLDTASGEAVLDAAASRVQGIEKPYRLRNGWAVRVLLKRQS